MPYTPGDQPSDPDQIKLNTNESPFPPSPAVTEACAAFSAEDFRRYPDPAHRELNRILAKAYGVEEDQVFTGVGSDDVLSLCFLTFFHSEEPILFPDITYSFYEVWAGVYGVPYETVPLTDDLRIRIADYKKENGGILLANPNAPTGIALTLSEIEELVSANPDSVVICDEAYVDFGTQSALPLVEKYENLLIVQTFSKSRALAGLRVGFAIGSKDLIRALNDVKYSINSYTLNKPAQILAKAAIEDEEYYRDLQSKIVAIREETKGRLMALGFEMTDSGANFLFVSHPRRPAKELFEELRKRHIYVRWFDRDRIRDYLRITIGTGKQMDQLICALEELLA